MMFRDFAWPRRWRWALLCTSLMISLASGSSWGASVPEHGQVPTAHILETQIVVQNEGYPKWHEYEFTVPKAGTATLRLSNGAKTDASYLDRILGITVTLCSSPCAAGDEERIVYSSPWFFFYDILEVPVHLQTGTNKVKVHLNTRPGKRLSVRIDAPADALHLTPVSDTPALGESLPVRATLSGLGRPVAKADITFRLNGLGELPEISAVTNSSGVAKTSLSGFQQAGNGTLTTQVAGVNPALVDTVPIKVFDTLMIALESSPTRMEVKVDSTRPVSFVIQGLKGDIQPTDILFETIKPENGVEMQTEEIEKTGSSTLVVQGKITGRIPGSYKVIPRVTMKATGETATARIAVNVIQPTQAKALTLMPPEFVPPRITVFPDVEKATPVRFATAVSGGTKPPASVELQTIDPTNGAWETVPDGELKDNGKNGDLFANDRVYARQVNVIGTKEGEQFYRVVVRNKTQTVVSDQSVLAITRFLVGPDPKRPKVVMDQKTDEVFAAEQVLVSFSPDVLAERIEEIVAHATRSVTGQAGNVIGSIPQIGVLQVELVLATRASEADRAATVRAVVAELETYDAVRYAEPNFVVKLAQSLVPPDGDSTAQCNSMGAPAGEMGQWGARKIGAHKAWALPNGSGGTKKVAIVDTGVEFGNDLDDVNVDQFLTSSLANGVPVPVINAIDVEDDEGHGTGVAGIIAAKHNSEGISGIAHGQSIISFQLPDENFDIDAMYGVATAANYSEVEIINFSSERKSPNNTWECTFEFAATPILDDVGSDCIDKVKFAEGIDAAIGKGKGKLVVAAAGNAETGVSVPFNSYPCLWGLAGVLCVANTNYNDELLAGAGASNYGPWVDLTAPGTNVCTTAKGGGYYRATGTSFAAPHVAGAAAVVWSMNPGWSAVDVATHLKATAHPIDGIPGNSSFTENLGSGRLNLYAAVRKPDRLVLVLDKSGSMNWSSQPLKPGCEVHTIPSLECEPSRWTILNAVVVQMLDYIKAYVLSGDEFRVVLFDNNASVAPLTYIKSNLVDLSTFVSGHSPGGGTSIGAGLTALEAELLAGAPDYHQTILLFTDGDQNQRPYVVPDGSQVLINPTTNSAAGPGVHEFAPGAVDICPFALRADDMNGPLGTTYLQEIASLRCAGLNFSTMNISPTETDFTMFFMQVLNDGLIGDKLELARVTSGQVIRQGDVSANETFTTSRNDVAFTVLVNWAESGNRLKKVVLSKDGVDFPLNGGSNGITISSGDTYKVITLRQPYCRQDGKCVKSEGEWTLHMQPTFEGAKTFTYNLFLNVDNATLASKFRVLQPTTGVRQPLRITASLTDAGEPIQGLPAGSVRAVLSRPKTSLGNVLSKAQVRPMRSPDADPISAAGLKASAMLADPSLRTSILEAVEPSMETELILTESNPGLYEANFNDTHVSGMYSVRFYVKGHSGFNGDFTRTFLTARSVEVVTDGEATGQTIKVSPITPCVLAGGCYSITLTPMDAAGNVLGPGKRSLITVPNLPGRMLNPISDELDGRYTIRVGYLKPDTEKREKLVLDIQGVKLSVPIVESDKKPPAAPTNLQTIQ